VIEVRLRSIRRYGWRIDRSETSLHLTMPLARAALAFQPEHVFQAFLPRVIGYFHGYI